MKVKQIKKWGILVSSDGKIIQDVKSRYIYTQMITKNGYLLVQKRFKKSKRESFLVHRLVAAAYVKNPQNLSEVNHIDGNKQNNHYLNLEWVTHAQNMRHAKANGLFQEPLKPYKAVIIEMLLAGFNQTEVGLLFGIRQSTISRILLQSLRDGEEAGNCIQGKSNKEAESVDAGGLV